MVKNFLVMILLLLVASCGSMSLQKKEKVADQQASEQVQQQLTEEKNLRESLEKAENRLKEITAQAIKSGESSVQFLASDLFIKANDASIRGDSTTAALLFKYVHALVPTDGWVQRKYAVELIRMGELNQAEGILKDIYTKEGTKDENIGLILGGVYTALDKAAKARKVYKEIIVAHPKSEEACIFLSKSYALEKEYKKARQLLKKCERKMKGKAIFSYFLGKLAVDLGERKTAKTHFRNSLKIDKQYYQAAIALGLLFEEKEQWDSAVRIYKRYLKNDDLNYPVLSRLVQVLFANGKYEEVLPFAEKLSSMDQNDLNLKVRLGILYTDKKRFEDAIGIFKEILLAAPNSDKILYYLGSLYQQTSKFHNAITYFQKVPAESSLYLDSNLQIAQMLQALAMEDRPTWEPKLVDFSKKAKSMGDKIKLEVGVLMSSYWEGLNKLAEAINTLESLTGMEEFSEGHDYYLASLYEKNKQFDKARTLVEKMLVKNPENPHALNFLGYSLLEKGEDMDRAYILIKKAVDLKPEDGFIRDSLAWYYYKVGRYAEALEESKKANEMVDNDVVITKHLAIIYKKMEKYELAKEYYLKALKQCKVESERKDVLGELQELENVRLPASKGGQNSQTNLKTGPPDPEEKQKSSPTP